jgi:hypothetical protein
MIIPTVNDFSEGFVWGFVLGVSFCLIFVIMVVVKRLRDAREGKFDSWSHRVVDLRRRRHRR